MFSEDKGSFFIMAISVFIFLYIGAQFYNMFLEFLDPEAFQINEITDNLGKTTQYRVQYQWDSSVSVPLNIRHSQPEFCKNVVCRTPDEMIQLRTRR